MRKVKLVISDFHIGRGRWLEDGSLNPLEQFFYDEKFIEFLDYYSKDEFRRAEVELILNGDFLNTIQVDYDEELPEAITERGSLEKVRLIVEGHPELFEALRRFAQAPHHSLTYILGNHEPSLLWTSVRQWLEQALETKIRYPGFSYTFDGIYIEHGQQYHAVNRFDPNQLFLSKGLKEPIINLPWGSFFVIKYLNQLKKKRPHIDRIEPFGRYLLLSLIFDPWFALVFFFRQQLEWHPGQKNPIITSLNILSELSLVPNLEAYARQILSRGHYHTVILGHNHQPAYRKLGENQLYVNTGTWNDLIHLDLANLGRQRRMTGTRLVEEDVVF